MDKLQISNFLCVSVFSYMNIFISYDEVYLMLWQIVYISRAAAAGGGYISASRVAGTGGTGARGHRPLCVEVR